MGSDRGFPAQPGGRQQRGGGRGLDAELGERFVNMYVNERTLDYGEDGRKAVQLLLDRGHEAGLIPHQVKVDFV